jgi:hypothetical protein
MAKDPYKIVNSKPGWASKFASGSVALGSVATAIVITVPGLPGYEVLSQALASDTAQDATNPNGVSQGSETSSTSPSGVPAGTNRVSSSSKATSLLTLDGKPLSSSLLSATKSSTLTLPGISAGNTSSPTPYSTVSSSATSGSQSAGNVSSPTPSGSSSNSEDEYEDDEDEDDEDEDDDDEDDEDEDDD